MLAQATKSMPFFGAEVKGTFPLPSFYDNFDVENNKITDMMLDGKLREKAEKLLA